MTRRGLLRLLGLGPASAAAAALPAGAFEALIPDPIEERLAALTAARLRGEISGKAYLKLSSRRSITSDSLRIGGSFLSNLPQLELKNLDCRGHRGLGLGSVGAVLGEPVDRLHVSVVERPVVPEQRDEGRHQAETDASRDSGVSSQDFEFNRHGGPSFGCGDGWRHNPTLTDERAAMAVEALP